jgi:DNA repair exonuclease SbcCD ATPase subunit
VILSLELEYFLQHANITFTFTNGLNTIRGRNEGGKTSIFFGILYALFGAKVLPLSLEDTVTWGYPVKNLKVILTMQVDGQLYLFTRSASGAECRHTGGIVTGQKEVTKFASELLGADADRAMKLMIANQKSLAGALNEGPTALSEYIEDMSGMDLFDIILDAADGEWTTGPTKQIDFEIEELQEQVGKGSPAAPDKRQLESEYGGLETAVFTYIGKVNDTLKPAAAAAAAAYAKASAAHDMRQAAADAHYRAHCNLIDHQLQFDELQLAIVPVDEDRITFLEKSLADDEVQKQAMKAYKAYRALEYPTDMWEGDVQSLVRDHDDQRELEGKYQKIVNEAAMKIREAQAKKTTSSICGFCGEDFSQFPGVAEKNKRIDDDCEIWTKQKEVAQEILAQAKQNIRAMVAISDAAHKINIFYERYHAYVERDDSTVPAKLVWKGKVPVEFLDTGSLEKELADLKKAKRKCDEAVIMSSQLDPIIVQEMAEVQRLKDAIPSVVNITGLKEAKDAADAALLEMQTTIDRCEARMRHIDQTILRMQNEYEVAKEAYAKTCAKLQEKRAARNMLVFHTNLVKKIKTARPLVAAQLWSLVLTSASAMFSQLRGEQSIVTRNAQAFLVNGKSIKGLSGSAQDILGLAIRVALVKTFIPSCPFMLLDEPMSACDDERTKALLSFVTCSGFNQILLVTHEDLSADWSKNMIKL